MSDELRVSWFASWRERWLALSAEQRGGVFLFGVCGLAAVVFSGWYIHAQIRAPFLTSKTSLEASRKFVGERERAQKREAELRLQDTDGDGLNDWDELNSYKTSPYLADSDSDGVSDASELALGQDPNCPRGRDCQPRLDGVAEIRSATSAARELFEGAAAPRLAPQPGDLNAAQVRQFLLSNRLATEADLAELSDQALLALYRRAVASTPATTPPSPPANALPSGP